MYQIIITDLEGYCRSKSSPLTNKAKAYLLYSNVRGILPSNLRASIIKL